MISRLSSAILRFIKNRLFLSILFILVGIVVGDFLNLLKSTPFINVCYHFWIFINSSFFNSVLIIIVALVTLYGGMWLYFSKQRFNDFKRKYYEETFLKTIDNLELGIRTCTNLLCLSTEALNLIQNFVKQDVSDKKILINQLKVIHKQMCTLIPCSAIYKFRLEEIFGRKTDSLLQWGEKAEENFKNFTELVRGQIDLLMNMLETSDEEKIKQYNLEDIKNNLQNQYRLVQRHYGLLSLFNSLSTEIGAMKCSNINELRSFTDRKEISSILEKTKKAFFVNFVFHKSSNYGEENVLFSHVVCSDGKRFKLIRGIDGSIRITRETVKQNELGEPVIIQDESDIADSTVEGEKKSFVMELGGLANSILFEGEKKPNFIKVINKF